MALSVLVLNASADPATFGGHDLFDSLGFVGGLGEPGEVIGYQMSRQARVADRT